MPKQNKQKRGKNSPVISLRPDIRRFLCSQSSQDFSFTDSPTSQSPRATQAVVASPSQLPRPLPRPPLCSPPHSQTVRGVPKPRSPPGNRHGRDIRDFAVNLTDSPSQVAPCSPPRVGGPSKGGSRGSPRAKVPRRRRVPKKPPQTGASVPKTDRKRAAPPPQGKTKGPKSSLLAAGPESQGGEDAPSSTGQFRSSEQVGENDRVLCVQVNLNLRHDARGNLDKHGAKVQLIQEPPYRKGGEASLGARHLIAYCPSSGGDQAARPRAAIRVSKSLTSVALGKFWSRDLVACLVRGTNFSVVFASLYCDIDKPVIEEKFELLVKHCQEKSLPLIVGADTNAHSTYWGPSHNKRGLDLEDFIVQNDLYVLNDGLKPTFIQGKRKSWIDVTLRNKFALNKDLGVDWSVQDEASFSDHQLITFSAKARPATPQLKRDFSKIHWGRFRAEVENKVDKIEGDLELKTSSLIDVITKALDSQVPKCETKASKPQPRWWNSSLTDLKKDINKLRKNRFANFNQAKFDNLNRQFKYEVNHAKKESFRKFCTSADTSSELSRLIKSITSKPSHMALIKNSGGVEPDDLDTSHFNLLSHHFPGHRVCKPPSQADPPLDLSGSEEIFSYITPTIVKNALNSFAPNKSAGPDDLRPKVLQNLGPKAINLITDIYHQSIRTGCIPSPLLQMKVVFIPKDKPDKSCPKSYRPITLSSFILKGLERIIQWYLQETILSEPLFGQHAYTKNRSCDTALSDAVNFVERGLGAKRYTLMVSLDCSGAFDNLTFQSSARALSKAGVPPVVARWYQSLLSNRVVHSEVNEDKKTIFPTKGSPQGGVLSPLVWILAMDSLLSQFKKGAVRVVGYADDVLLRIQGLDPNSMVKKMQKAIDTAVSWAAENGLRFNPAKTECCFFHNKQSRSVPTFDDLKMGGVTLKYSSQIKYLGLILDQRLTFKPHLEQKCLKAKRLLNLAKQVIGKEWGLAPHKVMWVYNSIVRPQVTYGSLVWANKINKTLRRKLDSVQRAALLSCTHSMRSTPTAGLEATLGVPPLALHCQEVALKAAYRVQSSQDWFSLGDKRSHRDAHLLVLRRILPLGHTPYQKTFGVNRLPPPVEIENPSFNVYTDGSKDKRGTGYGYCITQGDHILDERSKGLDKDGTVFMAEMLAIIDSLEDLRSHLTQGETAVIWTDSSSSIKAIYSPILTQPLALEAHNSLRGILSTNLVNLRWVRGHDDNTGNEMADFLAKNGRDTVTTGGEGTDHPFGAPKSLPYTPPNLVKGLIRKHVLKAWEDEWTKSNKSKYIHSKRMLPLPNVTPLITSGRQTFSGGREELRNLVEVITGHCLLNKHLAKWRRLEVPSDKCRLCEETKETYLHLTMECPALELDRRQTLKNEYENPLDYFKDLLRFVKIRRIESLRRSDLS